jgi:hypothetical protein
MSDADWERIEAEWETPEEKAEYEFKPPKQKGLDMDAFQRAGKKKKQTLIEESQVSSGPAMMFATLDYPDCCNKKKTEEIGTGWASMLRSSGQDVSTYVIEENQILYSAQSGLHADEIRDFLLAQPECVAVEWNQKRVAGPAETPEWIANNEAKKALKDAEKAKQDAEKEAVKKAEARAKRKKKMKKKAAKAGTKTEL